MPSNFQNLTNQIILMKLKEKMEEDRLRKTRAAWGKTLPKGLGDEGYISGVDLKTGEPSIKLYSPEEKRARLFQKKARGVTGAELKAGKQPLRAQRLVGPKIEQKFPGLTGKRWLTTEKGLLKEQKPKEKIEIDEGLTENVINRIGTDEEQLKLFIKNVSKFEKAGVDINRVFNVLFSTAKAKKKSGFLKVLKEVLFGKK